MYGLEKLKHTTAIAIVSMASSIVPPGFLYFYIYNRNQFENVEGYKLTVLALVLGLPIFFYNCILLVLTPVVKIDSEQSDEDAYLELVGVTLIGSGLTAFVWYTPILAGYLYCFEGRTVVYAVLTLQSVVTIAVAVIRFLLRKSK